MIVLIWFDGFVMVLLMVLLWFDGFVMVLMVLTVWKVLTV